MFHTEGIRMVVDSRREDNNFEELAMKSNLQPQVLQAPETRSRRRLQFAATPLQGKSFFLHVQSAVKARELEKKLKDLGGVVEKFLSKELSCVITDEPTVSKRSSRSKEVASLTLSGTRGQSRAQTILQKSVGKHKQPAKSTDVVTNAEKWGIQVKPVEQVLKWIDAQKKHQATAKSRGRVCSLKGAFLKVEDHSRQYKPLVRELRVWPQLNLDAAPGFSPFDEPVSMRTRSRSSSKSPSRGANRAANQTSSGSANKKGYCEVCDVNYVGMKKHVNNKQHKQVASREDTYAELDRLIGRGKSLKEFENERIRKRTSNSSMTQIQTRSRSRSRSPVALKSTPQKSKNTPRKPTSSPRRSSRKTPSRKSRTPSPGRRTPSRRSGTPSPARTSPSSRRKASKTVTPIKIVRFQDDQYSVVKSTAKKRRRNESDNDISHKSKRKRTDRYSIVEATPMRIRLRRSRRKASSTARGRSS